MLKFVQIGFRLDLHIIKTIKPKWDTFLCCRITYPASAKQTNDYLVDTKADGSGRSFVAYSEIINLVSDRHRGFFLILLVVALHVSL